MRHLILAFILLAYLVLGALYAVFTPKWQAPDEPAHFNYVRTIGETGGLPVLQVGDYDQAYLEQIKAAKFPATMSVDAIRYEAYQPPLYYLAATPVYLLARGAGLEATVLALRLFSVALGALALLVAFRIVRAIFPDDDVLALAIVGVMATVPQHLAVSASISNDLAAELVLLLILWLAVKRAQNAIRHSQFVILGGILYGAALLTKTTAYVPGALLLLGAAIAHGGQRSAVISQIIKLIALALLIASPMLIRGALTYGVTDPLGIARHDAVVAGQPTTAEVLAQRGAARVAFDLGAVTFKSFWAQFGWMGVLVNDRIYVALALWGAVALVGFAFYVLRLMRHPTALIPTQRAGVGWLMLLLVAAFADYVAYNFKFLQFQGRYLFPALVSIAFVLVVGLRELIAREYQRVVFALLYLALLALDLVCLFGFIVPQLRIAN